MRSTCEKPKPWSQTNTKKLLKKINLDEKDKWIEGVEARSKNYL
jgi:hypothetical protein